MRKHELHPRTAALNKTQKNQSKHSRFQALQWLAEKFPDTFDNNSRIRPLKLGIMDDILAYADEALKAGISKSKLREAVVLFTRRVDYLTCLKAREIRVDLKGMPVATVNEEESERAVAKIKKRVEKSARNARKMNQVKAQSQGNMHHAGSHAPYDSFRNAHTAENKAFEDSSFPVYPQRSTKLSYSGDQSPEKQKTPAAVMVKHKSAKAYDPDAVARLKAKLGLSLKKETEKSES